MTHADSSKREIHVAVIPDGNRRWSRKRGRPEWYGHYSGAKKMENFLDWTLKHPEIKTISVYGLSTENLNRPKEELEKLWPIYKSEVKKLVTSKKVTKNNIRVNVVGAESLWRSDFRSAAKSVMKINFFHVHRVSRKSL
jgi:tritrans,polycis-undecaprenyl-diphosphate synthase [geranylgeranyl-diphosphate specific]